jgi:hypothetical protein
MSDSGKITKGVETKLAQIYYQEVKGYSTDYSTKYTEKGKFCEQEGITLLQSTIFRKLKIPLLKNKERVHGPWLNGEHDVKVGKTIVDIKNCWDWLTFHGAKMTDEYEWQLRGYMMLNDCDEAYLFYALLTPPEHILMDEEKRMFYQQRKWATMEESGFQEACEDLRNMLNFNSHPVEERFKFFHLTRDLEKEEKIKKMVTLCRNRLHQIHLERICDADNNREVMGLNEAKS